MSDLYAIKETTLTALGDAVRSKTSKYKYVDETTNEPFINISINTDTEPYSYYESERYYWEVPIKLEELLEDYSDVEKLACVFEYKTNKPNSELIYLKWHGLNLDTLVSNIENISTKNETIFLENKYQGTLLFGIQVDKYYYDEGARCSFKLKMFPCDGNNKYRELNTYTPLEMVDAINELEIPNIEPIVLTGDCSYSCKGNIPAAYIDLFGDTITTKDITKANYMFYKSNVEIIPFEINLKSGTNVDLTYLFGNCNELKELPQMNNVMPYAIGNAFTDCYMLRFPENFGKDWDWSYLQGLTSQYGGSQSSMINSCYSLRKLPIELFKYGNTNINPAYSCYQGISFLYGLDEIIDLPFPHYNSTWTSNAFSSTFSHNGRIKNLTFALKDDGSPYEMKWKSQTIDLSKYVGYTELVIARYITDYNSGITADKEVINDTTYQALKNNPDWFTRDINYSRYNHDSAVNTINSLPDCSATGTNTIKFKGAAGALTDGGAINTLTEEEIAVATARGWTVSLV